MLPAIQQNCHDFPIFQGLLHSCLCFLHYLPHIALVSLTYLLMLWCATQPCFRYKSVGGGGASGLRWSWRGEKNCCLKQLLSADHLEFISKNVVFYPKSRKKTQPMALLMSGTISSNLPLGENIQFFLLVFYYIALKSTEFFLMLLQMKELPVLAWQYL